MRHYSRRKEQGTTGECLVDNQSEEKGVKVAELDQGSESQAHRSNKAGGTANKASAQRWVPPTARENVDPIQLVFRRIRGILNKITPDNFDKLSFELTHLPAINNKEALKGIILLVYDKALEEFHYTYMYAQLCRRLSDLVPNFEEPGSQSTTFRKLLLHKCQEEFENRRLATAAFERRDGLTQEEEEHRSLAKRKMLGNIRFVGELFKIGVLHEAIIHSCIKELLEKKKNQRLEDTIENIECLCHFMTTVGGRLDSTKAKIWMNKYFERVKTLAACTDFPTRIRFMLLDVIELRTNNWQPRRCSSDQGPRPIHEIREEVYQGTAIQPPLPPFNQPGFKGQYALPSVTANDEGFIPDTKDQHLFSPQESLQMMFPPHPYTPPHPSSHPHMPPTNMHTSVCREKRNGKSKRHKSDRHSKSSKHDSKSATIKKELPSPVKRRPMISESESEDDIPLAIQQASMIPSCPPNQIQRMTSPLATVKVEGKVAMQRKPAIKVTTKKEKKKSSGPSASEDDIPLAREKVGTKRKSRASSDDDEDFKPKKIKKSQPSKPKPASTSRPSKPTSAPATSGKRRTPVTSKPAPPKKSTASPIKGGRKKKEEEKEVWKWWEEEPHPEGVKWLALEHKGPYFAPPYESLPSDICFRYGGKVMTLSSKAEEAAGFFAKMLDHEYTTKDIFCKNFFQDWRKEMTSAEAKTISDFSKCDFKDMHAYYKQKSEERKAMSKEEKAVIKVENEKIVSEYGWCIIDGHKEKIGNFKIEPPGLFRGRGDHPKQGKIKRRIEAKNVIINIGKDARVPDPPPGHHWSKVHHDNKVTWLASWTENIQGSIKYVMLNPTSRLKGEKDWAKYEMARKLKEVVDEIRKQYELDLKSKEMKIRQRAVAMYFIDKLALRAGNEKDSDETADTVGCCSLRVEHITLHNEMDGKERTVEFDFLGKDSIRYYNKVQVDKPVFRNLGLFMEGKSPGDDLFDRLNTTSLNQHLSSLMPGLTAKVFRTYNASKTLQEQLEELTNEGDLVPSKILSYNRANRAVAILCNHQRAPPKTFDKQMSNLQDKINAKEDTIIETKSEIKSLKKEVKITRDSKTTKKLESKQKQLERLEDQLHKLEIQATDKAENKEIALGTSKLNYLDPRISVAWCKKFTIPTEKIYNKSQRDKFAWAVDMTDEDFIF